MKYIAHFVPQAWINDYAVEVDAEGPTEWDVTDDILNATPDEREQMWKDDTYESDMLRDSANAPEWVRDWSGPFYIHVELVEGP